MSDIVFVACCAIRLSPVLEIPTWLWLLAGVIVFIKMVNQVSALVVCKRFCFPHTWANKLTVTAFPYICGLGVFYFYADFSCSAA